MPVEQRLDAHQPRKFPYHTAACRAPGSDLFLSRCLGLLRPRRLQIDAMAYRGQNQLYESAH